MAIGGMLMYKTVMYCGDLDYADSYIKIREAFDKLVNQALQEGWKIQGGVDLEHVNRGVNGFLLFSVGMVKED